MKLRATIIHQLQWLCTSWSCLRTMDDGDGGFAKSFSILKYLNLTGVCIKSGIILEGEEERVPFHVMLSGNPFNRIHYTAVLPDTRPVQNVNRQAKFANKPIKSYSHVSPREYCCLLCGTRIRASLSPTVPHACR